MAVSPHAEGSVREEIRLASGAREADERGLELEIDTVSLATNGGRAW